MNRLTFMIITLVIMVAMAVYVRGGVEDELVPASPPTPRTHDIRGTHANCLGCHGNIVSSHEEMFGDGNFDNCLSCHQQL